MGVQKLDIEFEDEDETKAREEEERKKEEVPEEVDIAFEVTSETEVDEGEGTSVQEPAPIKQPKPSPKPAPAESPDKAEPAPQAQEKADCQLESQSELSPQPENESQSAAVAPRYQLGEEIRRAEKNNPVLTIEIEAKIRVAVAEKLTTVVAQYAQETKLLEERINRHLSRIAAAAPKTKSELIKIKKLLAEHAQIKKELDPFSSHSSSDATGSRKILSKKKAA